MSYQTFIVAAVYCGIRVESFTMDSLTAVLTFRSDDSLIALSRPADSDFLFEHFLHDALEFVI